MIFSSVVLVGPKFDKPHLEDKAIEKGKFSAIMCVLEDGDPPVSFSWTKDSKPVTSLPKIHVVNEPFSSFLTISAASSIHSGIYHCKASNPASWAIMSARILVNGIFKNQNKFRL